MTEQIHLILSTWNSYWGSGIYHWLLLGAILYLVIFQRKHTGTRQTVPYTGLVLLLFFFPVTASVIQKCIGSDVYWRVLWLLPTIPVIALAVIQLLAAPVRSLSGKLTDRISGIPYKIRRPLFITVLILTTSVTAVLCAGKMLRSDHYHKVSNYQKVPEEVAQICSVVQTHAGSDTIKLVSDENIIPYIRVYDASILMPYGRRGDGAVGEAAHELYELISVRSYEFDRIAALARETGCNFIVLVLYSDSESEILAKCGYQQIGTINNYGIFQYTEERKD